MGTESETIDQPQLLNSKFPELNNIKIRKVSAGFDHTLIVTEDNKVYALGKGDSGQLGMGAKITLVTKPTLISSLVTQHIDIKDACCGGHHSLILSGSAYSSLIGSHNKNWWFISFSRWKCVFIWMEPIRRTWSVYFYSWIKMDRILFVIIFLISFLSRTWDSSKKEVHSNLNSLLSWQ